MTRFEYTCMVVAFDTDRGYVWIRQGNAEQLGVAPGPDPVTFEHWNSMLNKLGGAGWELANVSHFDNPNGDETWLFKRTD